MDTVRPGAPVRALALHPSRSLAAAATGSVVALYQVSATTLQRERLLSLAPDSPTALLFLPQGDLLVGTAQGRLLRWALDLR